jgi:hypothetical protein
MRQPAAPSATTSALYTLVAAIPDDRLREVVLALALDSAFACATASNASREAPEPARRRPGRPKDKRKPAKPTATVDPKLALRRKRENEARKARRAAAATGREDGRQRPDAGNGKPGNGAHGTTATPSPAPAPSHHPARRDNSGSKHVMQARRARDRAARPADDADKAAGTTAAARLWAHAVALNAKEPWKPVAARLNLNMALCVDSWRSRELPTGSPRPRSPDLSSRRRAERFPKPRPVLFPISSRCGAQRFQSQLNGASHRPGPASRSRTGPMTDASPWRPPPGSPSALLAAAEPVYWTLMRALHAASLEQPSPPVLSTIIAVTDLMGDLIVGTGALWEAPDMVKALRALADTLEQRRETEPPKPAIDSLREFFASARPPIEH